MYIPYFAGKEYSILDQAGISLNSLHACMYTKLLQSCPAFCNPMDCSPPGFSVHGILQARILEWVAMPSPADLPNPGVKTVSLMSPALASRFFYH